MMRNLKERAKAYSINEEVFVFVFCMAVALVFSLGFFAGQHSALSEPYAVMCQVPEALR